MHWNQVPPIKYVLISQLKTYPLIKHYRDDIVLDLTLAHIPALSYTNSHLESSLEIAS